MGATKQKPVIDKHTKREKKNPNITVKILIKSQGKRAKEEERNKKELQKEPENN